MNSKSKEKVVAAFRKLFRSSDKISEQEPTLNGSSNSPSHKILGKHRPDAVKPVEAPLPEKPGTSHRNNASSFFKSKKSSGNTPQVSIFCFNLLNSRK